MAAAPESDTKGRTMALVAAFLGWMFDGLEMGLFPLAGRPALKELMHLVGPDADKLIGPWFGGIIAAFLIGAAAGGVLFGWLGDRVGRVKAMVWSVATYSIFSGLCGFVNAPWQLGGLRFIASLGMGGEWALGVSLISEIWPAKSRPLLSGLIGAAANVGFFLVGVVAILLTRYSKALTDTFHAPMWRLLFIAGAVPALLTVFIRIFVPESEKWKTATSSGPKPRVADIFAPGLAKFTLLGAGLAGIALLGTWASVQWIPPWTSQMTGNKHNEASWAQMFAAVGAVVLPLVMAILAERFNRRSTYVAICIGSIIACEVLFLTKPPFGFTFLLMVTLANGITGAFYGWLPLYLPELFPTRIRATGSGFCFNIGRVMAAAGALFGGQLLRVFNGDYARMCSAICLIYFAGLAVIYFCPETKGKPLPE
jgi:MFS family permease